MDAVDAGVVPAPRTDSHGVSKKVSFSPGALDAIDMGAELGANTFVLWGERDGTESHAAQPVVEALDRYV